MQMQQSRIAGFLPEPLNYMVQSNLEEDGWATHNTLALDQTLIRKNKLLQLGLNCLLFLHELHPACVRAEHGLEDGRVVAGHLLLHMQHASAARNLQLSAENNRPSKC